MIIFQSLLVSMTFISLVVLKDDEILPFGKWRDLTPQELDTWYSPFDLCMMNTSDYDKSPQLIKREHCSTASVKITATGVLGVCRVGMGSNKKECSAPYAGRKSYRKGIDGYTDASATPLIETFQRFSDTNTVLVLLGDSTMTQKRLALDCELQRESGPKMRINGTKGSKGVLPCHSQESVMMVQVIDKVTKKPAFVDVHGINMGPSSLTCLEGWSKGQKRPPEDNFEIARKILKDINFVNKKNMFIVANAGLWFNDRKQFSRSVDSMLNWLSDVASTPGFRNVVYWHETMAQHWPNELKNGYFDLALGKIHKEKMNDTKWKEDPVLYQVPGCCVNIEDKREEVDWRNSVIKQRIKEMDIKNVLIMPFADITKEVADMHVCSPHTTKQDCTHYCYWPLLWQYLWHSLAHYSKRLLEPS